jgi:hypothetical protein
MIERKVEKSGDSWEPGIESFTDGETGRKFRRIIGGLAWPHAGKPGFAVVIGEDFEEDPNLKARHLSVLKEIEESDVADLIRLCRELRNTYKTQGWYGCTSNKSMLGALYHLQKGLDYKDRFSFSPAPHSDDCQSLGYYLTMIKDIIGINRKILHFGEGSKLPGHLAEMGPESLSQDPTEFPTVAALGYVVAHIVSSNPAPRISPPKHMRGGAGGWM